MDEEIALLSVAPGFHFTLHTYPALGYVAVDLYSFEQIITAHINYESIA